MALVASQANTSEKIIQQHVACCIDSADHSPPYLPALSLFSNLFLCSSYAIADCLCRMILVVVEEESPAVSSITHEVILAMHMQ